MSPNQTRSVLLKALYRKYPSLWSKQKSESGKASEREMFEVWCWSKMDWSLTPDGK